MSNATFLLGLGVIGLMICGFLARKMSPVMLVRLWLVLGIAGMVLFIWGRTSGAYEGVLASLLLLIFAIPFFIGSVMAWLISYLALRREGPKSLTLLKARENEP